MLWCWPNLTLTSPSAVWDAGCHRDNLADWLDQCSNSEPQSRTKSKILTSNAAENAPSKFDAKRIKHEEKHGNTWKHHGHIISGSPIFVGGKEGPDLRLTVSWARSAKVGILLQRCSTLPRSLLWAGSFFFLAFSSRCSIYNSLPEWHRTELLPISQLEATWWPLVHRDERV